MAAHFHLEGSLVTGPCLLQVFSKVGAIKSCTISKKKNKAGIYPMTRQKRFLKECVREGVWTPPSLTPLWFPDVTLLYGIPWPASGLLLFGRSN